MSKFSSPPSSHRLNLVSEAGNPSSYQPQIADQDQQNEMALTYSVQAEEAVLGSLLIDRDMILSVAPLLKPQHFFSRERANLYQAILYLYAEAIPTDVVTLNDNLKRLGLLGEEEGQVSMVYLFQLMHSTPSPVHVFYYVEIVLKHWLSRQLIEECTRTIGAIYHPQQSQEPLSDGRVNPKPPVEPAQILADHNTRLQTLSSSLSSLHPDYFLPHEKTVYYIERFEELHSDSLTDHKDKSKPTPRPKLRFGWKAFDGQGGGAPPSLCLLPASLTTFLGRTSSGKTLLSMQIADTNAIMGLNVLYFHVELNQDQMMARRYCKMTGVPVLSQLLGQINKAELQSIVRASGEVFQWKGRVDFVHCPNWSIEKLVQELKARHNVLVASQGQGYDLVVLDYLQRLGRGEQSYRAPEHEVLATNVRLFSDCLNELNIAGLMTSQVGRNEGDPKKKYEPPEVEEGLGTGDIERCSNQLLALAISEDKTTIKYAIRKSTFGEVGQRGELLYNAHRMRLE